MLPLHIVLVDILPFASLHEIYSVIRCLEPDNPLVQKHLARFLEITNNVTLDDFFLYCDIYCDSLRGYPTSRRLMERLPESNEILRTISKRGSSPKNSIETIWNIGVEQNNMNVLVCLGRVLSPRHDNVEYLSIFRSLLKSNKEKHLEIATCMACYHYPSIGIQPFLELLANKNLGSSRKEQMIRKYLSKDYIVIDPCRILKPLIESWDWYDYDCMFLEEMLQNQSSTATFCRFMSRNITIHVEDLLDRLCPNNIPSNIAIDSLNNLCKRSLIVDVIQHHLPK